MTIAVFGRLRGVHPVLAAGAAVEEECGHSGGVFSRRCSSLLQMPDGRENLPYGTGGGKVVAFSVHSVSRTLPPVDDLLNPRRHLHRMGITQWIRTDYPEPQPPRWSGRLEAAGWIACIDLAAQLFRLKLRTGRRWAARCHQHSAGAALERQERLGLGAHFQYHQWEHASLLHSE